jgi:SpoVK/Ycf46/Vps4 family AAA+-type ATPase
MSDEQQDQIAADIAEIKALVAPLPGRLAVLEEWKVTHQQWADAQALEVSQRIERQNLEVYRQVSGMVQATVREAMQSGMRELFKELFEEMREEQRQERREEFKAAFGNIRNSVVWVQPILTLLLGVIALYAAFGR